MNTIQRLFEHEERKDKLYLFLLLVENPNDKFISFEVRVIAAIVEGRKEGRKPARWLFGQHGQLAVILIQFDLIFTP